MTAATTTKYTKRDPISHILTRPDMYVGTKVTKLEEEYVYENGKLEKRKISYSPAIVRCFNEILSNAVDNVERSKKDNPVTKIVVTLTPTSCSITNDGYIIPIEIHVTEKVYNHSLIFGQLLSGSNYDDTEKRYTSGRNGLGAKLTNVFSKKFTVECVDPVKKLKFTQTWSNNMRNEDEPIISKITAAAKKGYTKIYFELDFLQFDDITQYSSDVLALFARFVLDAGMITGVKVFLNDTRLPNNLNNYLQLIDATAATKAVFVNVSENTKFWVSASPSGEFEHISFVNGARTRGGGKHVDACVEAVCRPIVEKMTTKTRAATAAVTVRQVKSLLRLLIVTRVPNPEYDSQEKNVLERPSIKIAPISDATISKICKLQTPAGGDTIVNSLKSIIELQEKKSVVKTISAASKTTTTIEGYDKANYAATSRARDCTLIVCEGLSAKTFAVAGIEKGIYGKKGRNYFGIFPLRGKVLNTRNATETMIGKNTIITNLINILGLNYAQPDNLSKLAYGKLCTLTDADVDGIHIEGLILNFFHSKFPKLLADGFVISMKTPILKIIKTGQFLYDERNCGSIEKIAGDDKKVKYYKGLGTTKAEDVGEIFGSKILELYTDDKTRDKFELAFNKSNSDDRKIWLANYNPQRVAGGKTLDDHTQPVVKYSITDLLDNELVMYFYEDCARTLPSVFDGLKESQRKVLYAAKKRKLVSELKVAQFGAYVAENTAYHHGEQNLMNTIINMAQSFPGTNNIPLFAEEGMFGTRLSGGEDAANARYIFTKMTSACLSLFPDDDVYDTRTREGNTIEPAYYIPILPMLLINGCLGIAAGWMCSCPNFNPDDVRKNAKRAIRGKKIKPMIPWYRGFKGPIIELANGRFETKGVWTKSSSQKAATIITVTELPIRMWNDRFKTMLENDPTILSIKDLSTVSSPHFILTVSADFNDDEFEKRMSTTVNTNNIVVFDENNKICRVSVEMIFEMWARKRIEFNEKRKTRLINELKSKIDIETQKAKFIRLIKSKIIDLTQREDIILDIMKNHQITNTHLLEISLRQLTEEKAKLCDDEIKQLTTKLAKITNTSAVDMWLNDSANVVLY